MRDSKLNCIGRVSPRWLPRLVFVLSVGCAGLASPLGRVQAGDAFDPFVVAAAPALDPFEAQADPRDPFDQLKPAAPVATPLDAGAYFPRRPKVLPRQVDFQIAAPDEPQATVTQPARAPAKEPCAAATEKSLRELGIGIALPSGQLPTDHAAVCWDSLRLAGGPLTAVRCWPEQCYQWDATSLCHRPLYFEEINLERYGYGCGCCLQPVASAAHFFATVPALPYCMAAECPHECVYTLGHYRPGSCPPRRCHWPPLEPLAAAAEAGVMTGMIFLIP